MKNTKQLLIISLLSFILIGCGSDSNPTTTEAFPESRDKYEGAEGDNTPETAPTAEIGTSYTKTLFPILDTDWTAVTLTAGIQYEVSANKLCASCDTKLYLFEKDESSDTGYTQLEYNDDTIYLDSSVKYTPTETKTYYIHVTPYNEEYGISTYTLNVHEFIDYDEDDYSSFYDCNDQDASIYPYADEIAEDGIDQNCTGSDLIANETQDAFESDNTIAEANEINFLNLGHDEAVFIFQQYANDIHTIHDENDVDWFSISVPANSAFEPSIEYSSGNFISTLYEEDGTTEVTSDTWYYKNETGEDATYYLKISSSEGNSAFYLPTAYFYGYDLDQDGFYTMQWDSDRDCDDTNAAINPDAEETPDDGIDQDCNGQDNPAEEELELAPVPV